MLMLLATWELRTMGLGSGLMAWRTWMSRHILGVIDENSTLDSGLCVVGCTPYPGSRQMLDPLSVVLNKVNSEIHGNSMFGMDACILIPVVLVMQADLLIFDLLV
jgi:hypothetical protein